MWCFIAKGGISAILRGKPDLPIGPPVLSSVSPADAPGNGTVNTATREMKMANPDLRLKLHNKTFITAPGVFDLVSAKLVDRTQVEAIYMSGFSPATTTSATPGHPTAPATCWN